jgi:hypothetical protein
MHRRLPPRNPSLLIYIVHTFQETTRGNTAPHRMCLLPLTTPEPDWQVPRPANKRPLVNVAEREEPVMSHAIVLKHDTTVRLRRIRRMNVTSLCMRALKCLPGVPRSRQAKTRRSKRQGVPKSYRYAKLMRRLLWEGVVLIS